MQMELNGVTVNATAKEIRSAMAKARKEEAKRNDQNKAASRSAAVAAWELMRACSDIEHSCKRSWSICRADGTQYEREHFGHAVKHEAIGTTRITVDAVDGPGFFTVLGYQVEIVLVNGCGHTVAVKVRDTDDAKESYWMAVGVCEDTTTTVMIDGELARLVNLLVAEMLDYRASKVQQAA